MYVLPPVSVTQRTCHPVLSVTPVLRLIISRRSFAAFSSRDPVSIGIEVLPTCAPARAPSAEEGGRSVFFPAEAYPPETPPARALEPRGLVGAECRLSFPFCTSFSTWSTTSARLENFLPSGAKKRMRPTILRLDADHVRSSATLQLAPSITPVSSNVCLSSSRRAAASASPISSSSTRSFSTCSGLFTASPSTRIARRLKSRTCATISDADSNRRPPGEKKRR